MRVRALAGAALLTTVTLTGTPALAEDAPYRDGQKVRGHTPVRHSQNPSWADPRSDAYYALVKQLKAQGVPVQGYGVQGHLAVQYGVPADVPANLRRFSEPGLQTAFTEVPGVFAGEGSATPWDGTLAPEPAYAALRDTLTLAARH